MCVSAFTHCSIYFQITDTICAQLFECMNNKVFDVIDLIALYLKFFISQDYAIVILR